MTARLRRCEPVKPTVQRWRRKHTLQRRIFLWLGATIVVSAVVTAGLVGLLSPTERMQRDADGWARFVSGRLEEVWEALETSAGRPVSLDADECEAILERLKGMPTGRVRFEIGRALMMKTRS